MILSAPRHHIEPSFTAALMGRIKAIESTLMKLAKAATLRNASISGGRGLRVINEAGNPRIQLLPDGTIVAFDTAGLPAVRMGDMQQTGPEAYGIEVKVAGGAWVQLGSQNVTWANVANKPTVFAPAAHTHPGDAITSAVANASNAVEAGHAADADGAARARNNEPSGTGTFYAVWVDANGLLCKNTSAARFKENIIPYKPAPADVLAVESVRYRRKSNGSEEFGVIADQTDPSLPELTIWDGDRIDGFRYDLLAVAQQSVLQDHDPRIANLEAENKALRAELDEVKAIVKGTS